MEILLALAALALLAGLTASNVALARGVARSQIAPVVTVENPADDRELWVLVANLGTRMDGLTVAVSEGIAGYRRHEKRIQKTVSSARRLVREAGLEHAGIEAEYSELRPRDAEAIEPLSAVPEEVEPARTVRIPGGHLQIGAG